MKFCFVLFSVLCGVVVTAQDAGTDKRFIPAASSPNGLYLYLFTPAQMTGPDSVFAANTASFEIERFLFDSSGRGSSNPDKKFNVAGVTDAASLNNYFSDKDLTDLRRLWSAPDNAALASRFQSRKQISDYVMLYDRPEIKQALGHVFFDKEADSGKLYYYKIYRRDKQGDKTQWGISIGQSQAGNYLLPLYRPRVQNITTTDSLAIITWKMPVDLRIMQTAKPPVSPVPGDDASVIFRMPFSPLSTKANLYVANADGFRKVETLVPSVNAAADTLTYMYSQQLSPDEKLTAFLQTEDEVFNTGINSDTAYAFTVDRKTVPLLKTIRINEVVNGVEISWDSIDAKPYMQNILITRFDSRDRLDTVALLPVTDTFFTDYKLELGQTYRYQARLTFLPWLKLEQEVPAQGAGQFTQFRRPMPVNNLSVKNLNKRPVLTWDAPTDPSVFGAFIYRGTSPDELDLVAGPVKTNSYIDSADNVTGRNAYYYAVVNQNIRQDTSVFSETVSILPDKAIETSYPSVIDFYYFNDSLRVSWNDVRANDNSIEKYMLMRSAGSGSSYAPVANGTTLNNYFIDSHLERGVNYNYKVAAVSVRGDVSAYSEPYTYNLPELPIDQIDLFYLRNTSEGIQISMPSVSQPGISGYNIYRREATATSFNKVGSIRDGTFSFPDKNVKDNVIYVYAITIVTDKGREGSPGKSMSIRYLKN